MPAHVYQLHVGPITAFSFNKDNAKVAICPNESDLQIYAKKGHGYSKTETLTDVYSIASFILRG
jgi:actin related protein 2/3 complex subunit 1A/1B